MFSFQLMRYFTSVLCRLFEDTSIQMVTALVLQLVQCTVSMPDTFDKKEDSLVSIRPVSYTVFTPVPICAGLTYARGICVRGLWSPSDSFFPGCKGRDNSPRDKVF